MIGNPVLRKELLMRLRIRQQKSVLLGVVIAIVLLVGGLQGWLYYLIIADSNPAQAVQNEWMITVGLQYLLVCLVAPSVTANAITQEKEQQTWEMLLFTRLIPSEIIFGKLLARLVTVFLIVLLFMPISLYSWARAAQMGVGSPYSISTGQFFVSYLVMAISALFFATFGLFTSWLLKRTLYALMASYTFVVGGLCIGTALLTLALTTLFNDGRFFDKCPLMWINPVMLIGQAMTLNQPNTSAEPMFLAYGLICYIALTLLMLWRMIAGFRRFAYE